MGKDLYVSSFQGLFLNSEYVVVQYEDVLQTPELFFLLNIVKSKAFDDLFDFTELYKMTDEEIIEWYMNRPKKETFANLRPSNSVLEMANNMINTNDINYNYTEFTKRFVEESIVGVGEYIIQNSNRDFVSTLTALSNANLVQKEIIIFSKYSKEFCKFISPILSKKLGFDVNIISCNKLSDIIKEHGVTRNSTFVFSDITLINDMNESGILQYSSILVSEPNGYNKTENNEDFIIDVNALVEKTPFKLSFFYNYRN